MPIRPFDSVAPAIAAQATHIQRATLAGRGGVALGEQKRAERDREQRAERAVERQQMGIDDVAAAARERRRRIEAEHRSLEARPT